VNPELADDQHAGLILLCGPVPMIVVDDEQMEAVA
jgi:uncharacterized membrane protein